MERVKLYCRGEDRGEVVVCPEGVRTEVRALMPDPGDGLYRAVLLGRGGQLPLGVMEPAGGELTVCRRPYSRDLQAIGELLRGEARCSFRFQEADWRETCCPAQMFQSGFLQSRLRPVGRAWWRRKGETLWLALPLEEGKPFPLEALFCLAQIQQVEGRLCAVYAFREEEPVLPQSLPF